jgi:hypothetical protein
VKTSLLKKAREPFLQVLTEVPWFGPVVSAVLVALLVNIITEALTTWGGLWLGWAAVGVLALVTVIFVYAYARSQSRRRERGIGSPIDLPNPDHKQGLIFLFSRKDTLREAIDHHRPALQHCWLLATPEMQDAASEAISHFSELSFTLHSVADRYDSNSCYQTIRDIYQHEVPRLGLAAVEVISDITGGTKPMTLGMIMACLEGEYPIEHVPTAFNAAGEATGPLPPIQILVQRNARRTRQNGGTS